MDSKRSCFNAMLTDSAMLLDICPHRFAAMKAVAYRVRSMPLVQGHMKIRSKR